MAVIITPDRNTVSGTDQADVIYGETDLPGSSPVYLVGMQGDDTYVLDEGVARFQVLEEAGGGTDTVRIKGNGGGLGSFVLPNHVENLLFVPDMPGGGVSTADVNLTGNGLANQIQGTDGDNSINGGAGADRMVGLDGNDSYVVDNAADVVVEAADGGTDYVDSSVTFTLPAHVEVLSLGGPDSANINGTGNALANQIFGDGGDNQLSGLEGDDSLSGGSGEDSLSGGAGDDFLEGGDGRDTLAGGAGDDTYFADPEDAVITDTAGIDTVIAFTDWTLAAGLEHLTLDSGEGVGIVGTGNNLGNRIEGNRLNNRLVGLEGNDVLDGGSGADTLVGGVGNDVYVVDDYGDVVTELAGQGVDRVIVELNPEDRINYRLPANVEDLLFVQRQPLAYPTFYYVTGNELNNRIVGGGEYFAIVNAGAGNDILEDGGGQMAMQGGAGDDTFVITDSRSSVDEFGGQGRDKVISSVEIRMLWANVEDATLTGSFDGDLGGNERNNVLEGNAGDNFIDGMGGDDTMQGGAGDDTYLVDGAVVDTVIEAAGAGIDTVLAFRTSYTLGANVENLVLGPTFGGSGTGNGLDNNIRGNGAANTLDGAAGNDTLLGLGGNDTLTGGAGNDLLDGGRGVDSMRGGAGNDTYVVERGGDVVAETVADGGVDEVRTFVSFSLDVAARAGVENLVLLGVAIEGTGNALNNRIEGNAEANDIDGGAGNDTLVGGSGEDSITGTDTLTGGAGNDLYLVGPGDIVVEAAGGGNDTVRSGADFTLPDHVENLVLDGDDDVDGTGNGLANDIRGNVGDNFLDGGGGADTLTGGAGDDVYAVDVAGDVVVEKPGEGFDVVLLRFAAPPASFTLGANLEAVSAEELTSNINLIGNAADNLLMGSSGNNRLEGGAGNDVLDGGGGTDTLVGGLGNDAYALYLPTAVGRIVELAGQGTDLAYIDADGTFNFGAADAPSIEDFVLATRVDDEGDPVAPDWNITLTANGLANRIYGNGGAASVNAGGGDDVIRFDGKAPDLDAWAAIPGAGGMPTGFLGEDDTVIGGAGRDVLIAEIVNQVDPLNVTGVEEVWLHVGEDGEAPPATVLDLAAAGFANRFADLQVLRLSDSEFNDPTQVTLSNLPTAALLALRDFSGDVSVAQAGGSGGANDVLKLDVRNTQAELTTTGIERYEITVANQSPEGVFQPVFLDLDGSTGLQEVALTGNAGISLDLRDNGGGVAPDLKLKDLTADLYLVNFSEVADTLLEITIKLDNVIMGLFSGNDAFGNTIPGPVFNQVTFDTGALATGAAAPPTNNVYVAFLDTNLIVATGANGLRLFGVNSNVDGSGATGNLVIDARGSGADVALTGGKGFDRIFGGSGDDLLSAGEGGGVLEGGTGEDTFMFADPLAANPEGRVAYLGDFVSGTDQILLSPEVFTGLSTVPLSGALTEDSFFEGTPEDVEGDAARIIFDEETGNLYYDSDGEGAVAARLFANADGVQLDDIVVGALI